MSDETTEATPETPTPIGDAVAQAAAELERLRGAGKALGVADEPAAETETPAADAADVVEAPVAEEADVKARARGRIARQLAEAKKAKEEAEAIRAEARAEAERLRAEAAKERGEFEQLREAFRTNPDAFLEKAGWDLKELVQGKLEAGTPEAKVSSLERTVQTLIQRLEAKETAEKEREAKAKEATEAEAQRRQVAEVEKAFMEGIQADAHPMLARMAKRNEFVTKAQAYAVAHQFREEHGRNPSDQEIYENLERTLSGLMEEGDETVALTPTPKAKKLTPRASAAPAPGPIDFSKMTDDEKADYAEKELARMRLAKTRATS